MRNKVSEGNLPQGFCYMSFRTCIYVFAFGIITLPSLGVSQESVEGAGNNATGQKTVQAYPDLLPSLEGIENAIRNLIRDESEEERQRIADQAAKDLEAQTEMAQWAMEMALASIAAAIFTFGGLLLIWRTLYHTRRAADYTKEMLTEAKRTTSAMSRAWLKAEIEILEADHTTLENGDEQFVYSINVHIANIGSSPAVQIHTAVSTANYLEDTHSAARRAATEALAAHDVFGENSGLILFPEQGYIRPWHPSMIDQTGNKFIIAVINYKTIYDDDIHQTIVICGIGWNGMTDMPEDIETATFDWAGGFAT